MPDTDKPNATFMGSEGPMTTPDEELFKTLNNMSAIDPYVTM